jgi:hypothetical protein
LAARQQAHLVRLGAKLVLLSISPAGVETLSEVTDPDEVNRLAGLCQRARPDSATAAFRRVFQRFSKDHPAEAGKGDRHLLCEAPFGPFGQKVPVTFSGDDRPIEPASGGLEGSDV